MSIDYRIEPDGGEFIFIDDFGETVGSTTESSNHSSALAEGGLDLASSTQRYAN
jgi:hypothetical protein